MCCAPSAPMELFSRLYTHVCERRAIQRTCVAHDARSHTHNRERGHIHPCIDISNTSTRAWLARIPTFIPAYNAIVYNYYALMRAGYVLHSRECLECKRCSNVLRSLRAYGVPRKAVRTRVREKNDTAHVRSLRCAIPYTQPTDHAYVHADIPNTNTRACLARIPTFNAVYNAIVYIMHKRAPLLWTHASRLCTALTRVFGVWSCGQVLQQCAALPPRL
jgi:hypothetical protein